MSAEKIEVSQGKKIIEKCWSFTHQAQSSYYGHVHGMSLSKAKYKLYLMTDSYEFGEFLKEFSFKRVPEKDLLEPVPMDIISSLSGEQLNIICHANGNDSARPSYRSHYNLSDAKDPDMCVLVKLGLMTAPVAFVGGESYNWFLTEFGAEAASSLLPIQANLITSTVKKRNQLQEWIGKKKIEFKVGDLFELRMFKANPKLKKFLKSKNVLIRSGEWGAYFRPNNMGFTDKSSDAGIFKFTDAFNSTMHCSAEKQISFQII